jgi:hypothetical protein
VTNNDILRPQASGHAQHSIASSLRCGGHEARTRWRRSPSAGPAPSCRAGHLASAPYVPIIAGYGLRMSAPERVDVALPLIDGREPAWAKPRQSTATWSLPMQA